ncbi:MAG: hypothetical protein JXR68_06845 [Bacteroidales bacterium]|nr:hypothetical protein [Bacteroidales bacterium]
MKKTVIKILIISLFVVIFSCQKEENTTDSYLSVTDAYFCYKNRSCIMPNHKVNVKGFPVKNTLINFLSGTEEYFTIYDPITNYKIDVDFFMVNDSLKIYCMKKIETFPENIEFFIEAYYQADFYEANGNSDVKIFLNDTTFFIK